MWLSSRWQARRFLLGGRQPQQLLRCLCLLCSVTQTGPDRPDLFRLPWKCVHSLCLFSKCLFYYLIRIGVLSSGEQRGRISRESGSWGLAGTPGRDRPPLGQLSTEAPGLSCPVPPPPRPTRDRSVETGGFPCRVPWGLLREGSGGGKGPAPGGGGAALSHPPRRGGQER